MTGFFNDQAAKAPAVRAMVPASEIPLAHPGSLPAGVVRPAARPPVEAVDPVPAGRAMPEVYPEAGLTQLSRDIVPPTRPDYLEAELTRMPSAAPPVYSQAAASPVNRAWTPPVPPRAETRPRPGPAPTAAVAYREADSTQMVQGPAPMAAKPAAPAGAMSPAALDPAITQWGQGFVPADWPETARERQASAPRVSTVMEPAPAAPSPEISTMRAADPVTAAPSPEIYPEAGTTRWGQGFVPADWAETPRERQRRSGLPPEPEALFAVGDEPDELRPVADDSGELYPVADITPAADDDELYPVGDPEADDLYPVEAAPDELYPVGDPEADDLYPVEAAPDELYPVIDPEADDLYPVEAAPDELYPVVDPEADDLYPVEAAPDELYPVGNPEADDLYPVEAATDELYPVIDPEADDLYPVEAAPDELYPVGDPEADEPVTEMTALEEDDEELPEVAVDADFLADLDEEIPAPGGEEQTALFEERPIEDFEESVPPVPPLDSLPLKAEAGDTDPGIEPQDFSPEDYDHQPPEAEAEYSLPNLAPGAFEDQPCEVQPEDGGVDYIVPDLAPQDFTPLVPEHQAPDGEVEDIAPDFEPQDFISPALEHQAPDDEVEDIAPAAAPEDALLPVGDDEEIFPSADPRLMTPDEDEIFPSVGDSFDNEREAPAGPAPNRDKIPNRDVLLSSIYDDEVRVGEGGRGSGGIAPPSLTSAASRPAPPLVPSLKIPFRERTSVAESLQILGMASVALSVGMIVYTAATGTYPSFLEPEGRRLMFLEYSLQALSLFLLAWLGPPRGLGRSFCLIGLSLAVTLVIGAEAYHPVIMLFIWSLLAQLAVGTDADWLRRPHPLGAGAAEAFMVVDEDQPSHVTFNRAVFGLLVLVAAAAAVYNHGNLSRELARAGRGSPGDLEMAVMLVPLSLWPAFMAFALAAIGRRRPLFIGLGCLAALTFLAVDLWSEYALSDLGRTGAARLEYSITLQLAATRLLAWAALALALILLLARKMSLVGGGSAKPIRVWPRVLAAAPLAALVLGGLLYWGEVRSQTRVEPRAQTGPLTTVRMGELEFQVPAGMNQYNWRIYIYRPDGQVVMTETAYADGLTPEQGLDEALHRAFRGRLTEEIEIRRPVSRPMRLVAGRGYDSTRPNPGMTPNYLTLNLLLPQATGCVRLTRSHGYDPLTLAMDGDLREFINHHSDNLVEWADQYFAGYRWLGENKTPAAESGSDPAEGNPGPDGVKPLPGSDSGFKTRLGLFSSHPEGLGIVAEFGRRWGSRLEISLHLGSRDKRIQRAPYPYEEIVNYYQGRVVDYRARTVGGEIQAAELISYPLPPAHRRLSGWTQIALETPDQAPLPLAMTLRPGGRNRGDRDRPSLLGTWDQVLNSIKVVPQGLPLGEGPTLEQLKAEEETARAEALAAAGANEAKAKEEAARKQAVKEPVKAKTTGKSQSKGKPQSKSKTTSKSKRTRK